MELAAPVMNYCHGCGYELSGLVAKQCPECGTIIDAVTAAPCEDLARRPWTRLLRAATGRTVPTGWWALVSPRRGTAARIEFIVTLILTTAALALFFSYGSRVIATVQEPTIVPAGAPPSAVAPLVQWRISTLPLAALGRADQPGRSPFGTTKIGIARQFDTRTPEYRRAVGVVDSAASPYFAARIAWLSCGPAFAFLAMRFVLLRLIAGRRGYALVSPAAADLSVASSLAACTLFTIGACGLCFLAAILVPAFLAPTVMAVAPWIVAGLMVMGPPALLARQIAGDRSRRIFQSPTAASFAAMGVYVVALGLTVLAMGLTFRISLWLLT